MLTVSALIPLFTKSVTSAQLQRKKQQHEEDPISSMESLHSSADFKMQICPLVWRHVQLQLSHEQHWTKRHDVPVLSVTRRRRRPGDDRVLMDQIVLDSNTRLLPPTSRDLRRLRFSLQNGVTCARFQAPDELSFTEWCVAIVGAITRAEKEEQNLQTINVVGIVLQKERDNAINKLDHNQANVWTRDSSNYKLIRLHQPTSAVDISVTTTQLFDSMLVPVDVEDVFDPIHELGQLFNAVELSRLSDAVLHEDSVASNSSIKYASNFNSEEVVEFGHFVDAVEHIFEINTVNIGAARGRDCDVNTSTVVGMVGQIDAAQSATDNEEGAFGHLLNAACHSPIYQNVVIPGRRVHGTQCLTAVIHGNNREDVELDDASTVTMTSSDDEDERLDLLIIKSRILGQSSVFRAPINEWKSRLPTARETLRRRLMETDTRKHGMLPYHSPPPSPKQPEDEPQNMFDPHWL